ncbi:MAG: peptidoglycan editing factor PgeF [Holosporales bacterium]|jgi:YfiH family protein|nr:peptidoglycan editing factor PgeF [Holosporales bacterium]
MEVIQSEILSTIRFINHGFFGRSYSENQEKPKSLNVSFEHKEDTQIVLRNLEKIAHYFNKPASDLIMLNQKHTDIVHYINLKNIDSYRFKDHDQILPPKGDAIITKQKGILIGVCTADCAPILLCDLNSECIGAIHAGWRGTSGKIIENTISKMHSLGCEHIVAAIGPCLQKHSFEVRDDIMPNLDRRYVSYNGGLFFDMQLQISEKLLKAGVKTVSKINIDTFSNDDYFSYRRLGRESGVQFSGMVIN